MQHKHPFRPWTFARRVSGLGFLALLVLGTRDDFPWLKGSLGGTRVLGVLPFTDPLAAIEVSLAARAWMGEVLVGALSLVALALLLGPVFCGWLCPLGLLLELSSPLREFVHKLGARLPALHLSRSWKHAALGAALAFSFFSRFPVFQALSPIHGMVRALLFGTETVLWVIAGLVLVELLAPRVWCRSLCPLGALYSILGRRAPLRIHIDPERAGKIKCQRCEVACPMGIAVMGEFTLEGKSFVDHPDCTRCGACTEVCPNSVLRLGFRAMHVAKADDIHTGIGN